MNKYVIAFFMAWGGFLTIPCPYKKWDEKLKNLMLGFLSFVGLLIGIILAIIMVILSNCSLSVEVEALIVTILMFSLSGYIHLDGFMDVSDAVFSRRDLKERRRILKDSSVGAFAVISLIFLILAYFVILKDAIENQAPVFIPRFIVIPLITRMVAACTILSFDPMDTSQYALSHDEDRSKAFSISIGLSIFYILMIALWTAFNNNIVDIGPIIFTGVFSAGGSLAACLFARKNLAGMNGDIAGFSICLGGLCGLISCLIL